MGRGGQLLKAAERGDVAGIKSLLGQGADVNCRSAMTEYTPIQLAAREGHVEAVRVLIEAGADLDARNVASDDFITALHLAAYNGHGEVVQVLLQAGAEMDDDTYPALVTAAEQGKIEVVKVFLQAGANVQAKTKKGKTAIDLACKGFFVSKTNQAAIRELLVAAAASPQPSAHTLQPTTSTSPPEVAAAVPAADGGAQACMHEEAVPSPSTQPVALPTSSAAPVSDTSLVLYTGGDVRLPPTLTEQDLGVVGALVGGGFSIAVQVAAGVVTCNPSALAAVSLRLLQSVRLAMQQEAFCQQRLQRLVGRVSAMEPALTHLGTELEAPMRTGAPLPVVESLCHCLLQLSRVLQDLQALQQKLARKGPGLLQRSMQLIQAKGYQELIDGIEAELRDCLAQLSAVLNIAHFTQVTQVLKAGGELVVASWQQENKGDHAQDLQQLEGLLVEAVGGMKELQRQLAEQRVVVDGQVVGLPEVARWLQQMQADNALIVGHLQQMGQQLEGLGQKMGDLHVDVATVKDHMAQLVSIMMPQRTGQQRQKRVPMDSLPDLALSRERIQMADDLDGALAEAKRGAFGGVVQAQWAGHEVAVKVYNYSGLGRGDCKEAVKEAVMLSKANHPNIVRCYGVVYDPDTAARDSIQGSLVMEWVGGGTLYDWLQDDEQEQLGLRGRLLLALRVAEGMRHLWEKRLVHGDLKPQNILMSSVYPAAGDVVPQVKICDFGLSKYTSSSLQPTRHLAKAYTLAYTSPERTRSFLPSPQDDVYAFGILLYFIATASTPFSNIRPEHLKEAIQANSRPNIDGWLQQQVAGGAEQRAAAEYCRLAKGCWAAEAESRPTFEDIHVRLSNLLDSLGAA